MKNLFIASLWVSLSVGCFGQDSIVKTPTHSQIFSLSPISRKVDKVNGLAFGFGHVENRKIENQTIKGLNVEVNPAPIAGALIGWYGLLYVIFDSKLKNQQKDSVQVHNYRVKNMNYKPYLKMNGLNLSTGCFFTVTDMNGLNISLGNKFKNFNGLSFSPLGTISDNINGVSIGIVNANTNLNGAIVGVYNQTYELKGLQTGLVNRVEMNKGIQIGLYNRSYSKGFQLGVWNKNSRRSFPIVNW